MKKFIFALMIGALAAAGYAVYPSVLRAAFSVSGEVNLAGRLAKRVGAPNTVCYVVARNAGDVPVAIKRYVNPSFPLKFNITAKDMLLADSWNGPLRLEAQVNNRGQVGQLQAGDMFAGKSKFVRFYAANVSLTVDKMLGLPTLMAGVEPDKGSYMFTMSAR
ncbi:MAG: hypothetical protein PHP45_00230 [Elusimicrobiales bacterium]|nr:hypothetical protein [Elusimicrobiales bacterium]